MHIVMVEPEIPQNTGNIIRTCACTGATLHLIRPLGFSLSEKNLRRAGLDYIDLVKVYEYDSFMELYHQFPQGDFFFFTTKTEKNYTSANFSKDSFLVFGPETRGLPMDILSLKPENNLRIPMVNTERVRSLNLSNAVAIATYEVIRQNDFSIFK